MANDKLLTQGNPLTALLRFSLPFLLSNILQACYGASDLFMVGRFSDSIGVSAVATGGQVMQTITGLSIGLTAGGTVLIGRYFGARQRQNIAHAVKTMVVVFGCISLLLTAAAILLLDPICSLMQVPAQAVDTTRQYLFICACGILFIVGYNVISGILRGLGDSRTPLILITVACVINVSTDLLFVGALRMGAPGAALSTVIAQAVSLLLAVLTLSVKGHLRAYRRSAPCFRLYAAKDMLAAGLPIALQEGLVNVSFLLITAMINSMGLIASAAVGVVEKLIVFSMLPTTAFSAALSAMTAQHDGAGLLIRARRCLRLAVGLSLLFGVGCLGLAQWRPAALVGLFTADRQVVAQGALYLRSYSLDCVLVCFVFCMNAFLSGSGHPLFRSFTAWPPPFWCASPCPICSSTPSVPLCFTSALPRRPLPFSRYCCVRRLSPGTIRRKKGRWAAAPYPPAVSGLGRPPGTHFPGSRVCSSTAASKNVRLVCGPDKLSIARINRSAFFLVRFPVRL